MAAIACLREKLWHESFVNWHAISYIWNPVVDSRMQRIPSSHNSGPGGTTWRLHVIVIERYTFRVKEIQVWRFNLIVIPKTGIIEAEIINNVKDNVWELAFFGHGPCCWFDGRQCLNCVAVQQAKCGKHRICQGKIHPTHSQSFQMFGSPRQVISRTVVLLLLSTRLVTSARHNKNTSSSR